MFRDHEGTKTRRFVLCFQFVAEKKIVPLTQNKNMKNS